MIRAGVFIGVDRTGQLHELNDAAAGARRMHGWALQQGLDPARALLITDENEPVDAYRVIKALEGFYKGAGVDQVLLYFAGHGVNIGKSEYWLLSGAPRDSLSVINVRGSVDQAEYGAAQHVVVVSDACRVPAEGIQGQGVAAISTVVFPNEAADAGFRPVDEFYATRMGQAAAEVRTPVQAAAEALAAAQTYRALYTDALLDGLAGRGGFALEALPAVGDGLYVRPEPLAAWLERELPRRVKALGLLGRVNQKPEARLRVAPQTWIARLDPGSVPAPAGERETLTPLAAADPARTAAAGIVRSAVRGNQPLLNQRLDSARGVPAHDVLDMTRTTRNLVLPFGPMHMETQCGIKVRGAEVESALAVAGRTEVLPELLGQVGTVVRLYDVHHQPISVVLRFKGGFGAVIPALPGFLAGLSFDAGEMVDVSYEPSENHGRWGEYQARLGELRLLRAVAASASRHGRFKLDADDAAALAPQMQVAKGFDPTMALYAAYAYYDIQSVDRIRQMQDYLAGDLGLRWFDVALLARSLLGKTIDRSVGVVPFVPLLAQGWALLAAHRIRLHPALDGLQATLKDSLWSLYDMRGVEMLERALASGDVV